MRLDESAVRVVHVVAEVQLGHGLARVQVRLQHVLDLRQVQLRVVLLEVLYEQQLLWDILVSNKSIGEGSNDF